MRLFAGHSTDFIKLNEDNQLAELLKREFFQQMGYQPSQYEVMAWRNSLLRTSSIFQRAGLNDHGVFVEYQLPSNPRRIDVVVCGENTLHQQTSVLIELKQWEKCRLSEIDSERVLTWVAGGNKDVLHPSIQVGRYLDYLQENNSAFYAGTSPVKLDACSYLHNYSYDENDALFNTRFQIALDRFPLYTADDTEDLSAYLKNKLALGNGMDVLAKIESGIPRPSKKLLKQVSERIKDKLTGEELRVFANLEEKGDYILLDEQLVIYDTVISLIKKGLTNKQKFVIIVKGGPGTGKSVLGLQLLADLTALGRNAHYVTGSKSFTETLRKILGHQSQALLKYSMSYDKAEPNEIDVMLMDEAHRIRERTPFPFPSTGRLQVHDLIRAAKVNVFFIDDFQGVRAGEIGSSGYIKEAAKAYDCKVYEYELEAQFRCGGSNGYINWVTNTLLIQRTANVLWKNEENFEFSIVESPELLMQKIKMRAEEGFSARLVAGFCWPWSSSPEPDGSLKTDVVIGSFAMPWNARAGMTGLKKGIPASQFWAYDPYGIEQIGCIYTAQGFEFDYCGVIFGNDLVFIPDANGWEGHPENSYDTQAKKGQADFLELVKNTYRVLLTRGMKGCYVYFMNKDTERFFRSRIEMMH